MMSPRSLPRRKSRWPRLVACLLALVGIALGARFLLLRQFAREHAPDLRRLLAEVAARPSSPEPRMALAQLLAGRQLLFGVAMELSLLPEPISPEAREAAAVAFARLGLPEKARPLYRSLLAEAPSPELARRVIALDRDVGEFAGALETARAAFARWPDDPAVLRDYLRALLDAADYSGAIAVAEPALRRNPDDAELRTLLAWAHLLRGEARTAALYFRAVPREPVVPWIEVLRGRALLGSRGAVEFSALREGKSDPERARALRRTGEAADLRAAAEAFARAAAAAPDLPEAYLGLAETALRGGRWEEAARHARRAAELAPLSTAPWGLLAGASAALGRRAHADWALGNLALAEEDPARARQLLERAVRASPDPRFVEDLARANLLLFQRPAALDLLARFATRTSNPRLARRWYDSAFDLHDYRQALEAARLLAAHAEPSVSAEGHALAGQALRASGRLREAVDAFSRALERSPGEPVFLTERALTLLDLGGDPDSLRKAEADLRTALAARPTLPPAHHQFARLRLAQGAPDEAFLALLQDLTLIRNSGLEVPLALLSRVCARLNLRSEARWCAQWATQLSRARDRLNRARAHPPTAASDAILAEAARELHEPLDALGACRRLARRFPKRADVWLALAAVCHQLDLYDDRVAAMERWRALVSGSPAPPGGGRG